MSSEKFTPGEWVAHLGIMEPTFVHTGKEADYVDGETPVICELHHGIKKKHPNTCTMDFDHSEMNANAALIAAAPEMYKVLKRLVELTDYAELVGVISDAKKTLKEARGEE